MLKWCSARSPVPGHVTVRPLLVPLHVTFPFVEFAVRLIVYGPPGGTFVIAPSSSRRELTSIEPVFENEFGPVSV